MARITIGTIKMQSYFQNFPSAAVALSGGVDSAYLLYLSSRHIQKVRAYFVKTVFQPDFELEDAVKLCHQLGVELSVLKSDILRFPQIAENPADRCYYCKHHIFSLIRQEAEKDGFPLLFDGTNADDSENDRPGFRALRELEVRSPLRELGLTKKEIRRLSAEAGLFTHDKPAYACLATRIPTGERITLSLLEATQQAENFLHHLGFRDFRVRCIKGEAHIQIKEAQFPLYDQYREQILRELEPLYEKISPEAEVRL